MIGKSKGTRTMAYGRGDADGRMNTCVHTAAAAQTRRQRRVI